MASERDAERFGRALRLLEELADRHPGEREEVTEIVRLLAAFRPAEAKPPMRARTGEGVSYRVAKSPAGEILYEHRPAGQPLRVDFDLFERVVEVLAGTTRALSFDDISEGLKQTAPTPAEWQVRVVLRFLQHGEKPLIRRNRSRYFPATGADLKKAAAKLWRGTRS